MHERITISEKDVQLLAKLSEKHWRMEGGDYPIADWFGLRATLNEYLDNEKVSLRSFIGKDSPDRSRAIETWRRLQALEGCEFGKHCLGIIDYLSQLAAHYKLEKPEACLDDHAILYNLIESAYNAPKRLTTNLFARGEPGRTLQLNPHVYVFRNFDHLIGAALTQKTDGITVAAVCEPGADSSLFFSFVLRYGGNLLTLSDIDRPDNPLFHLMTRRPERTIARRLEKGNFPYQLIGDEVESGAWIGIRLKGDLFEDDPHVRRLAPIASLPADQAIWIYLTADTMQWNVIQECYPETLSYTPSSLRQQLALTFNGKEPEKIDLDSIKYRLEQEGKELPEVSRNRWMEDRYGHLVNPEILEATNLAPLCVADRSYSSRRYFCIEVLPNHDLKGVHTVDEATKVVHSPNAYSYRSRQATLDDVKTESTALATTESVKYDALTELANGEKVSWLGKTTSGNLLVATENTHLATLLGSRIGTAEEIAADRRWIARKNYASVINEIMSEEYERCHEDVTATVRQMLKDRADVIIPKMLSGSVMLPCSRDPESKSEASGFFSKDQPQVKFFNHLSVSAHYPTHAPVVLQEKFMVLPSRACKSENRQRSYVLAELGCVVTGKRSAVMLCVKPQNAVALAMLMEVSVSDLPEVLWSWDAYNPYVGNSILDKVDPVADLTSPWQRDWHITIGVAISRSAWKKNRNLHGLKLNNRERKALGMEEIKDE